MNLLSSGIGLKPFELYGLTLDELTMYIKGYKAELKKQAVFSGTIAAAVYNVNRSRNSTKWYTWSDIFGGFEDDEHTAREMTSEQIAMTLHGMFGGDYHQ